jgi:sugar O-acyltransferase (sialic acid O-acetyltransferase NeuD family)
MGVMLRIPMINANDESAELVSWSVADGAHVHKGDVVCIIETTKSAVDVVSEIDGFFRLLVPAGQKYNVGCPIAFIAEFANEEVPSLQPGASQAEFSKLTSHTKWTKKAKILADKLGINIEELALRYPEELINEDMVKKASSTGVLEFPEKVTKEFNAHPLVILNSKENKIERVLVLGGGGGAALVLDILNRSIDQSAVGILDNNSEKTGTDLNGIPILGGFELAEALWRQGTFDALISTVVRDVFERSAIYERFMKIGIPFTNVIDPETRIGNEVILGKGNLIIYGSYLATSVKLGNNNFLAAGTFIEHHSEVGNHCTFGPRTSLAGGVLVGNHVKFGMQVAIEPQIEIGSESVIASGIVITSNVPTKTIVKSTSNAILRQFK